MISLHFNDRELACRHCGVNHCTLALLDALESLRRIAGSPVTIDDAYRCAIHNAAVHGEPNSEHVLGNAADIRIAGMDPEEMYLCALKVPAFRDGGIGVAATYIHVDTRPHRARWTYGPDGRPAPWNPALDALADAIAPKAAA